MGNETRTLKRSPVYDPSTEVVHDSVTKGLCAAAQRISRRSAEIWGEERRIEIVGASPPIETLLRRVEKIAPFDEPVLVLGESGVGKESLAQAIYLMGNRTSKRFVSVNCPQFQEGNLTVSELFGHRKGSFTGATADRKGCFETANGGVIFLDEIGDLPMSAQVMLMRALANGEFQPLGSESTRRVNVRVVAATNRSLNRLAARREFRRDLLFRLRYFPIEIPPLRERGDDWLLLIDHFLYRLHERYGEEKRFSEASLKLLEAYSWPGNVRELISLTTSGYALCDDRVIEPIDFADKMELEPRPAADRLDEIFQCLGRSGADFWSLVQQPYLDRELNRSEVKWLINRGFRAADGSYRRLLQQWSIPLGQYQKFMDFLRHHRLKPASSDAEES